MVSLTYRGETVSELHDDLIVFHGPIISDWSRDIFADMRRAKGESWLRLLADVWGE